MGIFDRLTGRKKGNAPDENELNREEKEQENRIAELKKEYEDIKWPVIIRLNPVNTEAEDAQVMDETVDEERKREIGELIFDEDISSDTLKFLNPQELLFLLTTLEVFNKKKALPGYESNHRKVYNEILGRIRDAEFLYVIYDLNTGFPFIDHGYGNVYFEEDLARKACEMFNKQFRKTEPKKCPINSVDDNTKNLGFFDFLYYTGIDNLIIDNGAYRARFKRNEIVPAAAEWSSEKTNMPINPKLNFAMLDFLEEIKWPVKYEKRTEVLKAKELRMMTFLRGSKLLVPIQHEGPAEMMDDGRIKLTKDTKLRFLVMRTNDDKEFIPVFTDTNEFAKLQGAREWNAGVFAYADILKLVNEKDGIRINPEGQGLVFQKERLYEFEKMMQQQINQAKASKASNAAKAPHALKESNATKSVDEEDTEKD